MHEPVTAVTDYALAVASLVFAVSLREDATTAGRLFTRCWRAAFVAAAVAATTGGTFHAMGDRLAPGTLRALWDVAMFSMGACAAFITAAVLAAGLRREDGAITWLVLSVAVTVIGIGIQQTGWRHGSPVNHNDVYHLVQMAGLFCFFRFARAVGQRSSPGAPIA